MLRNHTDGFAAADLFVVPTIGFKFSEGVVVKPWFSPSNYDVIRRAGVDNFGLPHAYNEWLRRATSDIADIEAEGKAVIRVVVVPEQFTRFCQARGEPINSATLVAFVGEKSVE